MFSKYVKSVPKSGNFLQLREQIPEAYAYLDPGSGSVVIQMLIGALAGVGITLKIYWHKIKEKLVRN